jgi:hypothetical protein
MGFLRDEEAIYTDLESFPQYFNIGGECLHILLLDRSYRTSTLGRKQQRYAKLHSVLEDAVVSRGYQILGSTIPEQNVQEIEKQREVKGLIFLLS